jgi:hypothetical protein
VIDHGDSPAAFANARNRNLSGSARADAAPEASAWIGGQGTLPKEQKTQQ